MSKPRIIGFAGNLRRPSRSRALVEALGAAAARLTEQAEHATLAGGTR